MITNTANFTIYNASAGAGKTYNLSKEYIKLLLASDNPLKFKEILAITFTNKAAAEMKLRILGYLDNFSKGGTQDFFDELQEELAADATLMQKRAKNALQGVLHNYSAFAVTTIDKFTHKLIKSFAHDMELPVNFEVELDTDKIAQESVATLLSKVGKDKRLDKAIIAYALDKAGDDKSWDVSLDLHKAAKYLFNENDSKYIKSLKGKGIDDFISLQKQLNLKVNTFKQALDENITTYFTLLDEKGIANDIKSVPTTFFKNIKSKNDFKDESLLKHFEENKEFYAKNKPQAIKDIIDSIVPQLKQLYQETKTNFYQYTKYKNLLKELTPLTVINEIQKEYVALKEANNILHINEFNELISKEIKNQAAPYIYERIGEKYHHFFIDEFQDTSELQWQNLIPLIQNAVQSEYAPDQSGTLLLVGDAKQAIYRFRGGNASQFIDLTQDKNPFFIDKEIKNLDTNYRSYDEIITFTNKFFSFIKNVFTDATHEEIYKIGNQQKTTEKKGGYVSIDFIEGKNVAELDENYPQEVFANINKALSCGFDYKDIAILTRKRKQGIAIADFLTEQNIPIISSETLLLEPNEKIQLIIALLKLSLNPNNQEASIAFLEVFFSFQNEVTDRHNFYTKFINSEYTFFEILKEFSIDFDLVLFKTFNLFDGASYIVHQFGFDKTSDAYIQYFLDLIFDFIQRYQAGWLAFLDYWEEKKEKLSIASPEGQNAVQIMTIHKSKGLEFPVVIYPYADDNIYADQDQHVWLDLKEDATFEGFENLRYSHVSSLPHLDEKAQEKGETYRSALELDALNILYVTLTRPVEQLYIIASQNALEKPKARKPKTTFAEYIKQFLIFDGKWNVAETHFDYGKLEARKSQEKPTEIQTEIQKKATIIPWQLLKNEQEETIIKTITRDSQLWNTERGEAIDMGNLIHKIMEQIHVLDDVKLAVNTYVNQGLLHTDNKLIPLLEKAVNHSKLSAYFHPNIVAYNEREINVPSGVLNKRTIIIDRLVFLPNNEVVIIDYKTGESKKSYTTQLNEYERVLKLMGYIVKEKLLVYLDLEQGQVELVEV
jgi:ATP-dependent exoDNAse (exonuclease V) beta subunit